MMLHTPIAYARADSDALITGHSQMVRRIAWHVHGRVSSAIDAEDLIQIGMIALVEAARSYEDRGHAFATYASMRVRGAMIDHLRRDARMCRSGMARRREMAGVRSRLENDLRRTATDAEMAATMGLDVHAYQSAVASARAVQQDSIDDAYSDHDSWFADLSDGADTLIEQQQLKDAVAHSIASLSSREQTVLQLYFVDELNLDEIGETLGVGAARVCQIKKAALDRLRNLIAI
jgi:RNA polymerase sigma factor for flagellar operon FliA